MPLKKVARQAAPAASSRYAGASAVPPNGLAVALRSAGPAPELLVGYGFRGWVTGYQTGDVRVWERVWRLYSEALGTRSAELVVDHLAAWTRSATLAASCRLDVRPFDACGFCRDECLAISMVSACQHDTCPAMRACAFALIETSRVDEILHHATSFAVTMRSLDRIVPPQWIVNANSYVDPQADLPH